MATMRNVAESAGVSIATVSAVINNSAYVSDELRQRVLSTISKLDYRPNALARGLKNRRTKLLGFMVRNITNPFYPEVVLGAEDAAREAGYNILVCTTADEEDRERACVETMLEHRVDGMLVAIVDEADNLTLTTFKDKKVPIVLINRLPEGYTGNAVVADNIKAGFQATHHLISLKHKQIAFIGASQRFITSRHREQGYRQAMQEAGIPVPEQLIRYCNYSEDHAYTEYRKMIEAGLIPEAVFCGNDLMAFGVIRALRDTGHKVPEDVAVVGCDNIEFSSKFLVPLTTVHLPKYEMGKLGAELLIRTISSHNIAEPKGEFIQLKPHLKVRSSCGATSAITLRGS